MRECLYTLAGGMGGWIDGACRYGSSQKLLPYGHSGHSMYYDHYDRRFITSRKTSTHCRTMSS